MQRKGRYAQITFKDLSTVYYFFLGKHKNIHTTRGWPDYIAESKSGELNISAKDFKQIAMSMSVENGCLFYGARIVIQSTLQRQVLEIYTWDILACRE